MCSEKIVLILKTELESFSLLSINYIQVTITRRERNFTEVCILHILFTIQYYILLLFKNWSLLHSVGRLQWVSQIYPALYLQIVVNHCLDAHDHACKLFSSTS